VLLVFASAFGIGLAFCAPPGAITAEAIRRGLAGGFWPVFLLELGSLIGDATWAGIALVGAAFLVQNQPIRIILGLLGAALLFRLSWSALQAARRPPELKVAGTSHRGNFATGAMLALTNPLSVAFWVGVGAGLVQSIVPHPGLNDYVAFYAGYMLACVLWCFGFSAVIAYGRRTLSPRLFRIINAVCGTALVGFGIQLLRGVLLAA
jgi:threonine/homoserine/homoserine lactone efflux protein